MRLQPSSQREVKRIAFGTAVGGVLLIVVMFLLSLAGIGTGESLLAVKALLEKFDADVVAQAAILAEGDAADRDDIIFLEKLPLFFK